MSSAHDLEQRRRPRQLRRAGGATEITSQALVQVLRLADRGDLVSVPGRAHRVGYPGHLLFKSAMGRVAYGVGGGLCGIRDLDPLAVASTAYVGGFDCAVSRRGRVVDLHPSLA